MTEGGDYTVTAQAVSAAETATTKYTASTETTYTFNLEQAVTSVTAVYAAKTEAGTEVNWAVADADYSGDTFLVTLYRTDGEAPVQVATAEATGVLSHVFTGELEPGTYYATVAVKGDAAAVPPTFDSVAVASESFTVTTTPEHALAAPTLSVSTDADGKVILSITNNQNMAGHDSLTASCIGDYAVTITKDGEPPVVTDLPVTRNQNDTVTAVDITAYVADAAEYEITAVLKAAVPQPEGHYHTDSQPSVAYELSHMAAPQNVSIDAMELTDHNGVVVSWEAGDFSGKAQGYVIKIVETVNDEDSANVAELTVDLADLTAAEGRYQAEVTDLIRAFDRPEGVDANDIRTFRAEVMAQGDGSVSLNSAWTKAGVAGSEVYHSSANVQIANVATDLKFDLSNPNQVRAVWTAPTAPTADAGYTLTVYNNDTAVGQTLDIAKDATSQNLTNYIENAETSTYSFGLVTKGYVKQTTAEETLLVLDSAEARPDAENDVVAGKVPVSTGEQDATNITFEDPSGDSTTYMVYLNGRQDGTLPEGVKDYTVTVKGTNDQSYNKEVTFTVTGNSFDLAQLKDNDEQPFMATDSRNPGEYVAADYEVTVVANPANEVLNVPGDPVTATDAFTVQPLDGSQLSPAIQTDETGKTIVSWTELPGANSYTVQVKLPAGSTFETIGVENDGTSADLTDVLKEGSGIYEVNVIAAPIEGSTVYASGVATISLEVLATPEVTFAVTDEGNAIASWNKIENAENYVLNLYYQDGDNEPVLVATDTVAAEQDQTSYDFTEAIKDCAQTGAYRVEMSAIGTGSETISSAVAVSDSLTFTALAAATDVAVDTATDGQIIVSFTDSNDEALVAGYELILGDTDNTIVIPVAKTDVQNGAVTLTGETETTNGTLAEALAACQQEAGRHDLTATVTVLGALIQDSFSAAASEASDTFVVGRVDTSVVKVGDTFEQVAFGDDLTLSYNLGNANKDLLNQIESLTLELFVESDSGTTTLTPITTTNKIHKQGTITIPYSYEEALAKAKANGITAKLTINTVNGLTVVADPLENLQIGYETTVVAVENIAIGYFADMVGWTPAEGAASYTVTITGEDGYNYTAEKIQGDDYFTDIGDEEHKGELLYYEFPESVKSEIFANRDKTYTVSVEVAETTKDSYVPGEALTLPFTKVQDVANVQLTNDTENDQVTVSWTPAPNADEMVAGYQILKYEDGRVTGYVNINGADVSSYNLDIEDIDSENIHEYSVEVIAVGKTQYDTDEVPTLVGCYAEPVASNSLTSGSVPSVLISPNVIQDGDKLYVQSSFAAETDLTNVESLTLTLKNADNQAVVVKTLDKVDGQLTYQFDVTKSTTSPSYELPVGTYTAEVVVNSTNANLNADSLTSGPVAYAQHSIADLTITAENGGVINWNAACDEDGELVPNPNYNVRVYYQDGDDWVAINNPYGVDQTETSYTIPGGAFDPTKTYRVEVTVSSANDLEYTETIFTQDIRQLWAPSQLVLNDTTLGWTNSNTEGTVSAYVLTYDGVAVDPAPAGTDTSYDLADYMDATAAIDVPALTMKAIGGEAADGIYYVDSNVFTTNLQTAAGAVAIGALPGVTEWGTALTAYGDDYSQRAYTAKIDPAYAALIDADNIQVTLAPVDPEKGSEVQADTVAFDAETGEITAVFNNTDQFAVLDNVDYTVSVTLNPNNETYNQATTSVNPATVRYDTTPLEFEDLQVDTATGTISFTPQDGVTYSLRYPDNITTDVISNGTITLNFAQNATGANLDKGKAQTVTLVAAAAPGSGYTSTEKEITMWKLWTPKSVVFDPATAALGWTNENIDLTSEALSQQVILDDGEPLDVDGTASTADLTAALADLKDDNPAAAHQVQVVAKGGYDSAEDIYYIDAAASVATMKTSDNTEVYVGQLPAVAETSSILTEDGDNLTMTLTLEERQGTLAKAIGDVSVTLTKGGTTVNTTAEYSDGVVTVTVPKADITPNQDYTVNATFTSAYELVNTGYTYTSETSVQWVTAAAAIENLKVDRSGVLSWTGTEGAVYDVTVGATTVATATMETSVDISAQLNADAAKTVTVTAKAPEDSYLQDGVATLQAKKVSGVNASFVADESHVYVQWSALDDAKGIIAYRATVNGKNSDVVRNTTQTQIDVTDLVAAAGSYDGTVSIFAHKDNNLVDGVYYVNNVSEINSDFVKEQLVVGDLTVNVNGKNLQFEKVANAASYTVSVQKDSGTAKTLNVTQPAADGTVTIDLTTVDADVFGSTGRWTVSVVANAGTAQYIDSEAKTTSEPVTVLDITGLTATANDNGTVTLSWARPAAGTTYTVSIDGTEVESVGQAVVTDDETNDTLTLGKTRFSADKETLIAISAKATSSAFAGDTVYVKVRQLAAPESVTFEKGQATWTAVENAGSYVVTLLKDDIEQYTVTETNTTADLSAQMTDAGAYTVSVVAKPDGTVNGATSADAAATLYAASDAATSAQSSMSQFNISPTINAFDISNITGADQKAGAYEVKLSYDSRIAQYKLRLTKDGDETFAKTGTLNNANYSVDKAPTWNITNYIQEGGAGTYTVTVTASGDPSQYVGTTQATSTLTVYEVPVNITSGSVAWSAVNFRIKDSTVATPGPYLFDGILKDFETDYNMKFLLPAGEYTYSFSGDSINNTSGSFTVGAAGDNELTATLTAKP